MKKFVFALLSIFVLLSTSCGDNIPKDFVFVEGGTFRMGVELSDKFWAKRGIRSNMTLNQMKKATEKDFLKYFVAHTVKLNSFYICKHEVTQAEYTEIMDENPSYDKGNNNFPVGEATWAKAVEYCNKRSEKEGLTPCYLKMVKTIYGTLEQMATGFQPRRNGNLLLEEETKAKVINIAVAMMSGKLHGDNILKLQGLIDLISIMKL